MTTNREHFGLTIAKYGALQRTATYYELLRPNAAYYYYLVLLTDATTTYGYLLLHTTNSLLTYYDLRIRITTYEHKLILVKRSAAN